MCLQIACNSALDCVEVTWETGLQMCNECVISNGTCSLETELLKVGDEVHHLFVLFLLSSIGG